MGDQCLQLTHTWLLGEEAQEGAPGVGPRGQNPPALSQQGRPNQRPWLIRAWRAASDHALIHSFMTSFLPLTYHVPSKDQVTKCVECNCDCPRSAEPSTETPALSRRASCPAC